MGTASIVPMPRALCSVWRLRTPRCVCQHHRSYSLLPPHLEHRVADDRVPSLLLGAADRSWKVETLHRVASAAAAVLRAEHKRESASIAALAATAPAAPSCHCSSSQPATGSTEAHKLMAAQLAAGLVGREGQAQLLLLAALAGEHVLLVGPEGVGKTAMARSLGSLLCTDGSSMHGDEIGGYFERQLTGFTTPEELIGPLSVSDLARDRHTRVTRGYILDPTMRLGFLDEILSASSALLAGLLAVLEAPADAVTQANPGKNIMIVAANSVYSETDSTDGALLDRFILRIMVPPLSAQERTSLLDDPPPHPPMMARVTLTELAMAAQTAACRVSIPAPVQTLILSVVTAARVEGASLSDRRIRRAARLLRVAAAADGRAHVSRWDCLLLSHVFVPVGNNIAASAAAVAVREALAAGVADSATELSIVEGRLSQLLDLLCECFYGQM